MKMLVTYEVTGAYEVWSVEVPLGTTPEDILAGTADIDFLSMEDSGNTSMKAVEVEGWED